MNIVINWILSNIQFLIQFWLIIIDIINLEIPRLNFLHPLTLYPSNNLHLVCILHILIILIALIRWHSILSLRRQEPFWVPNIWVKESIPMPYNSLNLGNRCWWSLFVNLFVFRLNQVHIIYIMKHTVCEWVLWTVFF